MYVYQPVNWWSSSPGSRCRSGFGGNIYFFMKSVNQHNGVCRWPEGAEPGPAIYLCVVARPLLCCVSLTIIVHFEATRSDRVHVLSSCYSYYKYLWWKRSVCRRSRSLAVPVTVVSSEGTKKCSPLSFSCKVPHTKRIWTRRWDKLCTHKVWRGKLSNHARPIWSYSGSLPSSYCFHVAYDGLGLSAFTKASFSNSTTTQWKPNSMILYDTPLPHCI